MSLKICLSVFISALCLSFPQNLIGCADSGDPHDYYTSFFSRDLNDNGTYRPFYYTSLLTFYDDWDWDTETNYDNDLVISEWKTYSGTKASTKDVVDFIYGATEKDIGSLLQHLSTNKTLHAPDSFQKNPLTQCFITKKAVAPVAYLAFAKKIESISTTGSEWEALPPRDSLQLNAYLAEADRLFTATTDAFLKTKYAFLRCKVAFYNNRFADCIKWYDNYFPITTTSAVHNLALSYKAGSLYHLGKRKEAAYAFAKAFQLADYKKKKNYLGFLWATDRCKPELREEYISIAKTNEDKALMQALFAMHGMPSETASIEKVYAWDPSSPLLPLIAIREISKIEEQYLTPMLDKEAGEPYYYHWGDGKDDSVAQKKNISNLIPFLERLYKEGKAVNRELYVTGAAYLSFINKDYNKAKASVQEANKIATSPKIKDQLQLINLLIAVNEKETIDSKTENAILPSLNWLVQKAKSDEDYKVFSRSFFYQILGQQYQQQKDGYKAALAYGVADMAFLEKGADGYTPTGGLEYIRNKMETAQLVQLNQTLRSTTNPFEQFLVKHTSITNEQVIDVIGTSYLRDHDFTKAIEWLGKASKKEPIVASNYNYNTDKEVIINVNPLHDYLNDWQRYDKPVAKPYTKLSLAQKLLELQQKADTAQNTETKAKTYYQLASAYYNMSYYGNSWNAVAYDRSGSDWNTGNYGTTWQKEYYGVYKAKNYFQKAYTLSKDKEFKAAAFFLMAKCVQRQLPVPTYNYNNYEQYEKDQLAFQAKFQNNALFPQFTKEFGSTKFYQYTYNRCSYLRDFVSKTRK
jgi:hypothetical protein